MTSAIVRLLGKFKNLNVSFLLVSLVDELGYCFSKETRGPT